MELQVLRTLYQKGNFEQLLHILKDFEKTKDFQDTESLPSSYWVFYKTRALIKTGKRKQALILVQNLPQTNQKLQNVPELIKCLAHCNVLYADGRSSDALNILTPIHEILPELETKAQPSENVHYWIGFYYYLTGLIYMGISSPGEAIANQEKAISYFQEAKSPDDEAKSYYYIGNMEGFYHGKIIKSQKYLEQSLAIYNTIDSPLNRAWVLTSLGGFLAIRGEVKTGNTLVQEGHDIFLQLKNYQGLAMCKSNLGRIYYLLGDIEQAEQSLVDAMEYQTQSGMELEKNLVVYFMLVFLLTETDQLIKAEKYLHDQAQLLTQIPESEDFMPLYKYTEAFVLAKSPRLIQRAEAQKFFYQFLEKPSTLRMPMFILYAIFQLCGILIDELILTGDRTILEEIQSLFQQQKQNIEEYKDFSGQIELLLLESRLALVTEDISSAFRLVEQAETIAITHELIYFQDRVQKTKASLEVELTKWETLMASNPSIQEKIKAAQIEAYLKEAKTVLTAIRTG